ncbi:glycosyltransferase [Microbulbifer sp. ALW1]|uniref:glycosyltransferase n=1 Tax=Microbulbifer sp. (strain ALW1) TaxID=1516059 RepID=UPI00135C0BDA|nr:glycosyltransferase [Microbulbifer sp. ALW1]
MIFVSVGTQLPFDRLISAMDEWASGHQGSSVFAQIGESRYVPRNINFEKSLSISEYTDFFNEANLVVSHAGMGTIITALETRKPLIIMPREFSRGEHRNDHQIATAEKFSHFDLIHVVRDSASLFGAINAAMKSSEVTSNPRLEVSDTLIKAIESVIESA